MMSQPEPTLRLKIDAEALAQNWRALDAMSGSAKAGAAVKAECYGLGIERCVPILRDAGAEHFFVAHWSEVAPLLGHVAPQQVAVLHGPMRADEVDYAISTGVRPVINSLDQARRWVDRGGGTCHLMIDTGINRLGVAPQHLSQSAIQALDVDVSMSHLASADENVASNVRQLQLFNDSLGAVNHRVASLANSAGIGLGTDYAFDLTRPGLALYGGVPRAELADSIKQVAFPEATIIQIRDLKAGDAVGYNGEFVAPGNMRAATVSLGYADGFLHVRGRGASFLHDGIELPLIGKVSMDMVVVDLSRAPHLREGDWLTVPFDLPNIAQQSSVSQYELLTTLGKRFGT